MTRKLGKPMATDTSSPTAHGPSVPQIREGVGGWQFMPGKSFEAEDFEAFLALLPTPSEPLDVFIAFIDGAKKKAPAEAMALLRRLEIPTLRRGNAAAS